MISGTERRNWQQQAVEIPTKNLLQFGTTVVIAPHPDDESLGCGGTIALLRQAGLPVHVVFVSDGTLSHPNSRKYPAEKLRQLRESEARNALKILNVDAAHASFMRLKDRSVPNPGEPGFEEAASRMRQIFQLLQPNTILVTWEKDPHPDHRAAWQIINSVIANLEKKPRILQYLIWIWELGEVNDLIVNQSNNLFYIDIESVFTLKKNAIAAHISQVSRLIDDDPEGFILSPEILAHFDHADELFIEHKDFAMSEKPSLSTKYFDDVYNRNDDPWDFENSPYEHQKYEATLAALTRPVYEHVFEIGCSIGVLSKKLAPRSKKLLSVDVADLALAKATERLKDFPQVKVQKMIVPQEFPEASFDLILLSEVGYYLSKDDLEKLARLMISHLQTGGQLLLVHWTPFVPDYPQTGDEVHNYFMNLCRQKQHLQHLYAQREENFRLDLFEKI
ncbi:MAG: bifunctional PIG-L family deacetylase/class I SAM-dependent methyltransferase [Janthinobacterium lividum]